MPNLTLKGTLNLAGNLNLKGDSGGKLMIESAEALIQVMPSGPAQGNAPPVLLPPPPAAPLQPEPTVWIVNSFNKTVKANGKEIVALGMVMQGTSGSPAWPGMMLPSSVNTTVTIDHIAINVVNDQAIVFPSGASASFTTSGQS